MTEMRILIHCVLMVSLMLAAVGEAANYHVATHGMDTATGTVQAPFKTIQHTADIMQPGDTCIVHGGTYREWVKPPRGGQSENQRITYKAAPGRLAKAHPAPTGSRTVVPALAQAPFPKLT